MVEADTLPSMGPVGQNIPRADGPAKVTGDALYVDDIRPAGCLYGATVRADIAHGRLLGIEQDPDFDWTDIAVVTAADIPGENMVYLMTEDQPALVETLIRHVTEPIALVAAPTRDRALEAAKHIRVRTEALPAVLDPETAEGHATKIFGSDNVFKRICIEKTGEPAQGITVEGTYRVGHQEQLYIEPQGMIAMPREDGGLTLLGSMQCPFYIEKALAKMLPGTSMNVIQAATGGGFGGKEEYPSMVAAHAALLALKTGKPVKLVYRRDEDLRATTKRHPCVIKIRCMCTPEGKLTSWDAHILVDGGAYNSLTKV